MTLLLDTHIWVWSADGGAKLSREVRRQITNPNNEIYLSPVSIWEAQHLYVRKRLRTKLSFQAWLDEALIHMPLREALFTFAVAAEAAAIELPQPDLGDVFLAATARVYNLTLVTADPQLLTCSWLKTLPNE